MLIVAHAAAGALIGQQIGGNPLVIFTLAFVSHLLMDLIPHGDRHHIVEYFTNGKKAKKLYYELLLDSTAAIILVVFLMLQDNLNRTAMSWGIIAAVLPDLIVGFSEVTKNSLAKAFTKFHFITHNALIHKYPLKRLPGTLYQIALIVMMLYAL